MTKKKASRVAGAIGCYLFFEFITFMILASRHPEILQPKEHLDP